jgi:hypothetical protein
MRREEDWLKLTLANGRAIYVQRDFIISVRSGDSEGTTIVATLRDEFAVKETLDAILTLL